MSRLLPHDSEDSKVQEMMQALSRPIYPARLKMFEATLKEDVDSKPVYTDEVKCDRALKDTKQDQEVSAQ
jgi:hypothetical protein